MALQAAEDAFEAEYERLFGHRAERRAFELVNIHVIASVDRGVDHSGQWDDDTVGSESNVRTRPVYFGSELGVCDTKTLTRPNLSAEFRPGPAIVEEYDSTVVVPPGWSVRIDPHGNIVIEHQDPQE